MKRIINIIVGYALIFLLLMVSLPMFLVCVVVPNKRAMFLTTAISVTTLIDKINHALILGERWPFIK